MDKKTIRFKIKRQDGPDASPYWEEFEIPWAPKHNVVSSLMEIRRNPVNIKGERVRPVVWDSNCMEEVCGACTMLINGFPRQACSTLVDSLPQPIVLEPLTKFPVVRDLQVDREKMFRALLQVKAWVDIDGSWDIHEGGPRISQKDWQKTYEFARCMTCGCCMEVCPQFHPGSSFIGPAPLGQVHKTIHNPTGRLQAEERLHAIMGDGGIT
ncbi:MAG TPA: succinate dehydrogenase iron-sulfur subunit, partial [Planctomycetes bacterium]|nr:succinate dehydrogenase iron-sulfur subunit [Planctomycetota bacterium]